MTDTKNKRPKKTASEAGKKQAKASEKPESELGRKRQEYISGLAAKLMDEIQKKFRDEYKEPLAKMAAKLSRSGIPAGTLDPIINAASSRLALDNFDQYCWPDLPTKDRDSLKSYLQTHANWIEFEIDRLINQLLEGKPKAWGYALVDFRRLLAKSDPREVFERGPIEQLLKLVESHKKQRRTQTEIRRDAKKWRLKKARDLFSKFLAEHKHANTALHQLILHLKEPGYSERQRARGNAAIRKRYCKALGDLWPRNILKPRKNPKRKRTERP